MPNPTYTLVKNPRNNMFNIDVPMLSVRDAEIAWPNFSGAPDKFNRSGGKRYFTLIIRDPKAAATIAEYGYHMTISRPRDENETPMYKLRVNVSFHDEPSRKKFDPVINLYSNGNKTVLDGETVGCLDVMDISEIGLVLNPNVTESKERPGTPHVTAYLSTMHVVQNLSALDAYYAKFAEEESPRDDIPDVDDCPF